LFLTDGTVRNYTSVIIANLFADNRLEKACFKKHFSWH
ncbi:DNA-binding response regulator, partial [Staphylococcus aureus]|nr:DNA-binding response regulator [Staphylococcus aureus]